MLMIKETSIVKLIDGEHTDLLFVVVCMCMKFDDAGQCMKLCYVIEPVNIPQFMSRFKYRGIADTNDLSDIQIIVNQDEIELAGQ